MMQRPTLYRFLLMVHASYFAGVANNHSGMVTWVRVRRRSICMTWRTIRFAASSTKNGKRVRRSGGRTEKAFSIFPTSPELSTSIRTSWVLAPANSSPFFGTIPWLRRLFRGTARLWCSVRGRRSTVTNRVMAAVRKRSTFSQMRNSRIVVSARRRSRALLRWLFLRTVNRSSSQQQAISGRWAAGRRNPCASRKPMIATSASRSFPKMENVSIFSETTD